MGFEPTRGNPNGLAVHRLNHSATSSYILQFLFIKLNCVFICFYSTHVIIIFSGRETPMNFHSIILTPMDHWSYRKKLGYTLYCIGALIHDLALKNIFPVKICCSRDNFYSLFCENYIWEKGKIISS